MEKRKKGEERSSLEEKAERYFALCVNEERFPTETGLALYLGFDSRFELVRRAMEEVPDASALRRALSRIEEENLQAAYRKDPAAGAKLMLQNGFHAGQKEEPPAQEEEIIVRLLDSES